MVILVNDPYDIEINIKDTRHDKGIAEASYISKTAHIYMKTVVQLPPHKEFNNVFKNPQNKIRLP